MGCCYCTFLLYYCCHFIADVYWQENLLYEGKKCLDMFGLSVCCITAVLVLRYGQQRSKE